MGVFWNVGVYNLVDFQECGAVHWFVLSLIAAHFGREGFVSAVRALRGSLGHFALFAISRLIQVVVCSTRFAWGVLPESVDEKGAACYSV